MPFHRGEKLKTVEKMRDRAKKKCSKIASQKEAQRKETQRGERKKGF